MAKDISRKRQLKAEKRKRQKRLERARRGPDAEAFLLMPPGAGSGGPLKMSEVLEELVEPFRMDPDEETTKDFRELLSCGTLAWTIALYAPEEREPVIASMLNSELKHQPRAVRDHFLNLMYALIERKDRLFPHIRRNIESFELTETDDGYHLMVLSTFEVPPPP
jgi:hypothetical protein